VGGTAPYFHDGSALSLEELIEKNGRRMGHTEQLSKEDRAALVAFLRTL
jgi:cytochrome c peroxidase